MNEQESQRQEILAETLPEVREQTAIEKEGVTLYRIGKKNGNVFVEYLRVGTPFTESGVRADFMEELQCNRSGYCKVTAKAMGAEINARVELGLDFYERKKAVQEDFDAKNAVEDIMDWETDQYPEDEGTVDPGY